MNLVFWGEEHRCSTTAHMMAVLGMLHVLSDNQKIVTGRFLHGNSNVLAVCDCGTGLKGRKRYYLWHADLVVVCLKQRRACIDAFFQENLHVARNMVFLLGGYEREEYVDKEYLRCVYRIEPDRMVEIPYNNEFYHAIAQDKCDVFIRNEAKRPTNLANEQFIDSVQLAAVRIMQHLKNDTQ